MLQELSVKNYALIESLSLKFSEKLNIFTGETGAGKSIILDSLGLILGNRASVDFIRKGAEKCTVIGVFDIKNKDIHRFLKDLDTGIEDGRLIIRREIDSKGKSSCYCNDTPVTLQLISKIGDALVDIHGQNEHQVLLKTGNQLGFVDKYGSLSALRKNVSEKYAQWKNIQQERDSLQLSNEEREHKINLYQFQVKEIDMAELEGFDEEKIEQELLQLKNSEKLRNMISEVYSMLTPEDKSIISRLQKAEQLIGSINTLSGGALAQAEQLTGTIAQLKDIMSEIDRYREKLEIDPDTLDSMIERKDLILKLKKKYGNTLLEILEYRERIGVELEKLLNSQHNLSEMNKKINKCESELIQLCTELSAKRKKVCSQLEKEIEKEIRELGMPKAKFRILIASGQEENGRLNFTPSGLDKIEFMFSANAGEDLHPLKDIASGGEMSRAMLAIKTALGKSCDIPVMVFDEIDAGVSGPMSVEIGKKLKSLSKNSQIFCITHLAQIASFGNMHFKVEKTEKTGRTFTQVNELGNMDSRVEEIARLLSGKEITKITREHAKELIAQVDSRR